MGKNINQIEKDLKELCVNISQRHTGSEGNKEATHYAAMRLNDSLFRVEKQAFDCKNWLHGEVFLEVGGTKIESKICPYSLPCKLECEFETASSIEELEIKELTGKIVVLHGDICKEPIIPKNFVFYNPEEHQRIVSLLEQKDPLAIVAITSRHNVLAGAEYPFPMFQDGDFDFPAVSLTDIEGEKILASRGEKIKLSIQSERIQTDGCNVLGIKEGNNPKKIVFCAHIDAKEGVPGALDNATGCVVLLTLADLLKDYKGKYGIELLFVNGEDYYSGIGEVIYLQTNQESLQDTLLNVNIDGIGYHKGRTSFCEFECSEKLSSLIGKTFQDAYKFTTIEPWYQGDHMIFVINGVPAIALSSEHILELTTEITHTPKDNIDITSTQRLHETAIALRNLIDYLNEEV